MRTEDGGIRRRLEAATVVALRDPGLHEAALPVEAQRLLVARLHVQVEVLRGDVGLCGDPADAIQEVGPDAAAPLHRNHPEARDVDTSSACSLVLLK